MREDDQRTQVSVHPGRLIGSVVFSSLRQQDWEDALDWLAAV